ncbi:MAG: hypothetical protein WCS94_20845 [Verrucomicrobiota bacterium]
MRKFNPLAGRTGRKSEGLIFGWARVVRGWDNRAIGKKISPHYRELVQPDAAKAWFAIVPAGKD